MIRVHDLRHTIASLFKKLRVAPCDGQMIPGHADVSTAMQVYTHVDEEARDALTSLNQPLGGSERPGTVVSFGGQPPLPRSRKASLAGGRRWFRTTGLSLVRRVLYP